LNIAFNNFWPGFDKNNNLFLYCLRIAASESIYVTDQVSADIIIWSVFPNRTITSLPKNVRKKTNWFYTGENIRPNFDIFDAIFSFDFSSRKNAFRLPLWWFYFDWKLDPNSPHTSDARLNPYLLNSYRSYEIKEVAINQISAFIGNQTSLRERVISNRPNQFKFHGFGTVYQNIVKSKIALAGDFEFNICFENAYFPGYHTEKLPQAWAMKTIPLYYGAKTASLEFNPYAFINLSEFNNVQEFWLHVSKLTSEQKNDMVRQPLLRKPLNIDQLIDFIQKQINGMK
jgi:hypothetical protein